MCSGSEAGSYLRLIDFVYHSTVGLRVIKKKKVLCPADNPDGSLQRYLAYKKQCLPSTLQ